MASFDNFCMHMLLPTRRQGEGLILDFHEKAQQLPSEIGNDFITIGKGPVEKREEIAEASLIGFINPPIVGTQFFAEDEEIEFYTMVVKDAGTSHIALPECFAFDLGNVEAAASEILTTSGADQFIDFEIYYAFHRGIVETGTAHRPRRDDEGWHTDRKYDLVVTWFDCIGTEERIDYHKGHILQSPIEKQAPDFGILKSGGEKIHRSAENAGEPTLRHWSGLFAAHHKRYERQCIPHSENVAKVKPNDPRYEQFKDNAEKVLDDYSEPQILEQPQTLMEYEGN